MTNISPPPVPEKLREMLSEYPGHIERLQEVLNNVVYDGRVLLMPFDQAIWALEGRLETFIREANAEYEALQASGDAKAIARAEQKRRLMSQASWKHVWLTDEALWNYFQQN